MGKNNKIYLGDNLDVMAEFETATFDCMATDPPYGISFLSRNWDNEVPIVKIWKECLRVLKPGAFAFVMSSVRQDVLARMIVNLDNAGFNTAFPSIYWTYATGFPKGSSVSKAIDKRAGIEQKTIGHYLFPDGRKRVFAHQQDGRNGKVFKMDSASYNVAERPIKAAVTEKAKEFEGAYPGFSPKPAVEAILVAMKPLEPGCKSFVDQTLKNGHGCTWLGNCRIPLAEGDRKGGGGDYKQEVRIPTEKIPFAGKMRFPPSQSTGRFPTNLLCSDDVLNDGTTKESFSRYFSLESWFNERIKCLPREARKTFPMLIVPKPSTREKENSTEKLETRTKAYKGHKRGFVASSINADGTERLAIQAKNVHPTIKPIQLMCWLIILGTQEGDIVLDPFLGSGTTTIAAKMMGRYCKGIEKNPEYYKVAVEHVNEMQQNIDAYF